MGTDDFEVLFKQFGHYMYRLKFYLPFLYSIETRMSGSITGILNWISQYIIPIVLIIWFKSEYIDLLIFTIGLTLTYNLYEIGYIQNDTETIKKESNPTLRLNQSELNYYEIHKSYIYNIRWLIGVLCSVSLFTLHVNLVPIILAWLIPLIYQAYNYFRNGYIYVLHFILMEIRYVVPILVCVNHFPLSNWIFVSLMYPLPSIIVKLLKKKVITNGLFLRYAGRYSTRYLFVLKYYLLLLFCVFLFGLYIKDLNTLYIVIALYYSIRSILFYLRYGKKDNAF